MACLGDSQFQEIFYLIYPDPKGNNYIFSVGDGSKYRISNIDQKYQRYVRLEPYDVISYEIRC